MTSGQSVSIMVSAGEASGDAHAAHALSALADQHQRFTSFGMGASALQNVGTELVVDCRDLAVIGFVDVLINYPNLLKRLRLLRDTLRERKPDLLLLVDYPDFNLKLAETAKELDIPVLFYVSPQVWAWRAGRVPRIGSLVSHMAVLFPFEVDIYERANIPVTYVGNPVVEDAVSGFSKAEACEHFNLDCAKPVVTLLPGSRIGEIKRNLPAMMATAKLVEKQIPECQFLLPVAPTLTESFLKESIGNHNLSALSVVNDNSRDAMRAGNIALVASGTATLETGLIGTPMVVMYIVNAINYTIMKRLIRIPDVSLVNIVAQKRIVPEYIQGEAKPEAMAADLVSLLSDEPRRARMLEELLRVKTLMGNSGASNKVASLIRQLVEK